MMMHRCIRLRSHPRQSVTFSFRCLTWCVGDRQTKRYLRQADCGGEWPAAPTRLEVSGVSAYLCPKLQARRLFPRKAVQRCRSLKISYLQRQIFPKSSRQNFPSASSFPKCTKVAFYHFVASTYLCICFPPIGIKGTTIGFRSSQVVRYVSGR